MKEPVLIVGAGIAGISMAIRLEQRGIAYRVVDSGVNHSSAIAAGLINPMVFRRMTMSWRIQELLPETIRFYQDLKEILGEQYLIPIHIRRAFAHEQERTLWLQKQEQEDFRTYLKPLNEDDDQYKRINQICGSGRVDMAFYVETKKLLAAMLAYWKERAILDQEIFAYHELQPEEGIYKGKKYNSIVFCQGYQGKDNPWFEHLPIQQTKGEILTVTSDELPEDESLNRKCFVLPLGNKQFKVGSSYVWNTADVTITEEGKQHILDNLSHLTPAKVELIHQEAGVRPTVPDRRPLLGRHHQYNKLVCFNGLGTRGFVLAASMSKELAAHLFEGEALDPETDILRYLKTDKTH